MLTGPPGVGKTFAVRRAVEAVRSVAPREEGGRPFQVCCVACFRAVFFQEPPFVFVSFAPL